MGRDRVEKQLWLAEVIRMDKYGNVWEIKICDGAHSEPRGVTQAKRIHERVFPEETQKKYVMVTIEEVSNIDVEIDMESVDICKNLIEKARKNVT